MAPQEHYMLTHPIELHKAANNELIGSQINKRLTETRDGLREAKLMTKAAGLLTAVFIGGGAYEIGLNLNEGLMFAAAGLASGVGLAVALRSSDVLEVREAQLMQRLENHTAAISET